MKKLILNEITELNEAGNDGYYGQVISNGKSQGIWVYRTEEEFANTLADSVKGILQETFSKENTGKVTVRIEINSEQVEIDGIP